MTTTTTDGTVERAEPVLEDVCAGASAAPGSPRVDEGLNEVSLRGRVSAEPVATTLPSGDRLVTLRVVVARPPVPPAPAGERRRPTIDTIDCAVWAGRLQHSVLTWRPGDQVEVHGALRRRFFRAGGAAVSRIDVELSRARIIRRSGSASARPGSASAGTTSPSPEAAAL